MRVVVVGAGAVGGFLGARLALAHHDVSLVGRRAFVDATGAGGLTLIDADGSRRTARVRAYSSIAAALANDHPHDLALLTV